jgi:hypothetical protein
LAGVLFGDFNNEMLKERTLSMPAEELLIQLKIRDSEWFVHLYERIS